jgi:hypothetical protein
MVSVSPQLISVYHKDQNKDDVNFSVLYVLENMFIYLNTY